MLIHERAHDIKRVPDSAQAQCVPVPTAAALPATPPPSSSSRALRHGDGRAPAERPAAPPARPVEHLRRELVDEHRGRLATLGSGRRYRMCRAPAGGKVTMMRYGGREAHAAAQPEGACSEEGLGFGGAKRDRSEAEREEDLRRGREGG